MLKKFALQGGRYTPASLYHLFMVCAFPIHGWAILMSLSDFSWVAARTRAWDAVGLVSYALIFALFETLAVFVIVWALGALVPAGWDADKRVALLGSLFLVAAGWAIAGQVYSLLGRPVHASLIRFLMQSGHPLRIFSSAVVLFPVLSAALPAWAVMTSDAARGGLGSAIDRISLLASFYVALDVLGVLVVFIRSVTI